MELLTQQRGVGGPYGPDRRGREAFKARVRELIRRTGPRRD
jgi:hypothetical protein